jgi:hypothetical protein
LPIKIGSREVMIDAVMLMVNSTSVIHLSTYWSLLHVRLQYGTPFYHFGYVGGRIFTRHKIIRPLEINTHTRKARAENSNSRFETLEPVISTGSSVLAIIQRHQSIGHGCIISLSIHYLYSLT